jgi:DNA-binding response OmpR family regulator
MKNKLNILYIGKSAELISNLEIHHDISLILRDNLISALCYLKTERHPDAILCDSRVNGGDGLGFHKQLREHSEFDRVPFILMSDEFREDSMKKAFGSGVDDFFVIPVISAESLIERIRFLKEFRETEHRNSPRIPEGRHYRMPVSKRLFDIAMASSALVVFLPVLLIVMIHPAGIKRKGLLYFRQGGPRTIHIL